MTTNRGLYIHIPFCSIKCAYCDFYSVAIDTDLVERYAKEQKKELSLVLSRYPQTVIDTIYIGGGTPSVLPISILEGIVGHIHKCASVNIREFTIEINPCSSDNLAYYKSLGVNRVSIGVQTLNPQILKIIGRSHTPGQALDALERAAGIYPNVSADLMLGLPGQNVEDAGYALNKVMPFVNHISQYMLKLSDDTPMGRAVNGGSIALPDDDASADMYDAGYSIMRQNGYARYEISNFCKDKNYSLHNLKYWNREDYIGIGASAHSFIEGVRYENPSDLTSYLGGNHLGNGKANSIILSKGDALFEYIMLKLRLEDGFSIDEINGLFGIDFLARYDMEIKSLCGILEVSGGRVKMKKGKMLLESYAARRFLPD